MVGDSRHLTLAARRFDKIGSYRAKESVDVPGPGSYKAAPVARSPSKSFAGTRSPGSAAVGKGRVDFGPSGEGVPSTQYYQGGVPSTFSPKPRSPARQGSFGSSERFKGMGSYTRPTDSPGPGAYKSAAAAAAEKRSPPKFSFASPKMRPPGWTPRSTAAAQREWSN